MASLRPPLAAQRRRRVPHPGLLYQFAEPLVPGATRWHALVATIVLSLNCGQSFVFSLYSEDVKVREGWSDDAVNRLGFVKDLGFAIGGMIGGFFCDRFGIRWTALAGALMTLVGFATMGLSLQHQVPETISFMYFLYALGMFGAAWLQTGAVVSLLNFPLHKGYLAGLIKGCMALSTALYTEVYQVFFRNNTPRYMFAMGFIPFACVVVCLPVLQLFKLESYSLNSTEAYMDDLASKATFRQTSYIIFSILFVSLGMAMIENAPTESLLTLEWHFVVLMGFTSLLLIVPWLYRTNLKVQQKERNRLIGVVHPASEPAKDDFEARTHLNPGAAASYGTAAPSTVELAAKVAMPMDPTPQEDIADNMDGFLLEPELGQNHTMSQAVSKFEFWMIWIPCMVGYGSGYTVGNNIGHLVDTLSSEGTQNVSVYISLFGVFLSLGRITSGFASDFIMRRFGINQVTTFAIGFFLMSFSMLGMAYCESLFHLYFTVATSAYAWGFVTTVFLPVIVDLFGQAHFSAVYNAVHISMVVGSFLFADMFFSIVYDANAQGSMETDPLRMTTPAVLQVPASAPTAISVIPHFTASTGSQDCSGRKCFRFTFLCLSGINAAMFPWLLMLSSRVKPTLVDAFNSALLQKHEDNGKLLEQMARGRLKPSASTAPQAVHDDTPRLEDKRFREVSEVDIELEMKTAVVVTQ